jgi:hypothetical protein
MFALNGIYDGKLVKLLDSPLNNKRYKVIVTFVEEIDLEDEEIRQFYAQPDGFDFWKCEEEDLYQDYIKNKTGIKQE